VYPQVSNGYATVATPEDIAKDETGITYPNLHRRIDDSLGLRTFVISIFGQPILKDEFNNDTVIPDPDMSEAIAHALITNSYDVRIVDVGGYVKDYVIDWVTPGMEAKFMWIVRTEDNTLEYASGYDLIGIVNAIYRDQVQILEPDTETYKVYTRIETDGLLSKDTYTLLTSTLSSFRVTEYHTHDENSNSEIP
jgi:hypothetical protein